MIKKQNTETHRRWLPVIFLFSLAMVCVMNSWQVFGFASTNPKVYAGNEEMATFDQEEEASFDSEPAPGAQQHEASPTSLLHTDHYHPPRYFPERVKRSLYSHPWIQIFPFAVLIVLALATTQWFGKRKRKPVLAKKRAVLGKVAGIGAIILLITSISVNVSNALSYSSVKDAVVSFMGEGRKIYQTNIDISPDIKKKFKKELQWETSSDRIKVFYSKTEDGSPEAYAFVLSDRLPQCGGLHKYCIKISSEGQVEGVKILELTCDRSYCINNKAFLNQFKSFNSTNIDKNKYDAISGATLSTDLTLNVVRRALMLYNILKGHANA